MVVIEEEWRIEMDLAEDPDLGEWGVAEADLWAEAGETFEEDQCEEKIKNLSDEWNERKKLKILKIAV